MVTSAVSSANLDVNSIVTQLMQIENRPLTALQTRQSGLQSKISAYGAIKSAYSAAGDAMAKLSSPIPFNAVKATSSDPASINVTASSKAVAGAYSGLKPMDAMLRNPGFFDAKVDAPAGADEQAEFLSFLGRKV